MSSKLDESDFVDRDLEAMQESGATAPGVDDSSADAPPSREELTSRVTETQQELARLQRMQEELERERTSRAASACLRRPSWPAAAPPSNLP